MKSKITTLFHVLRKNEYLILTIFAFLTFLTLFAMFLGKSPLANNPYNTYLLQALSWRQGRLDLGQDYPWLELAIYDGKYYCSFPPFPSYILFILSFIFQENVPEYFVVLFLDLIALVSLFKSAEKLGCSPKISSLFSLFLMLGSNTVFILWNPSVWFMAQITCLAMCCCSICFALHQNTAASLFFWSAAVGCRPMEALFLPIIIFLCLKGEKKSLPKLKWYQIIIKKWYYGIPTLLLALSYMILNYLRFGNITEFGHNYLPEFVRAENGQFSLSYVPNNFRTLMNLFRFEDGKLFIDHFGNLNMFLVNPICIFAVGMFFLFLFKRNWKGLSIISCILLLSALYMFGITMHRTMGAWQFGNRYSIDILPWIYYLCIYAIRKYPRASKYSLPFVTWGVLLNAVGAIIVYNY